MIRSYKTIKISIIEKEFIRDSEKFQKTVLVQFFGANQAQIGTKEYAFIDSAALKNIFQSKHVNLDQLYITPENFPEAESTENLIHLPCFSAENTFFNFEEKEFNFSKYFLENKNTLKFNYSLFSAKEISFYGTAFKTPEVDFEYCLFNAEKTNFAKTRFHSGNLSFKNAIFTQGIKDFADMHLGRGFLNLQNVEFTGGEVNFTGANFNSGRTSFKITRFGNGKVDFSRVKFGKDETSFEQTEFGNGDVSFRSAEFKNGKVNFTSAKFGTGEKSFVGTNFGNGSIVFKNTEFGNGKTSFRTADFGEGTIDFHFASFGKCDLVFDNATFKDGDIDFKASNFGEGKVSFRRTKFGNGDLIFEGVTFKGNFLISDSELGNGEFNFEETDFREADITIHNVDFGIGKVSFFKSKLRKLSLNNSQLNNYFDLRVMECQYLDLSNTVVKDILDINPVEFLSNISELNISGMRLLGRLYLDWHESSVKELIYNQKTPTRSKKEQFRILKENYSVTGQYSYEDEAYVEFKRTEALALLEDHNHKNPKLKLWHYLQYSFKWLVFDKMGKFATDPMRVLTTMVITYFLFSFAYILLGKFGHAHIISSLFPETDPRILSNVDRSFYHSIVTFLTIGYGDYYPNGVIRWLSGIEGFVGLFEMSYFTVAFVRKILR